MLFDLRGTRSNRDGIGARIKIVTASGRTLYNHATTSVGFMSSSDRRVHFGLGKETAIQQAEIRWPSGEVQILPKPQVDQVLRVEEPATGGEPHPAAPVIQMTVQPMGNRSTRRNFLKLLTAAGLEPLGHPLLCAANRSQSIPHPFLRTLSAPRAFAFVLDNASTPNKYQAETMAGGVAMFDYNNDGLLDLYFTNGAHLPEMDKAQPRFHNRLYQQQRRWNVHRCNQPGWRAGNPLCHRRSRGRL